MVCVAPWVEPVSAEITSLVDVVISVPLELMALEMTLDVQVSHVDYIQLRDFFKFMIIIKIEIDNSCYKLTHVNF